MASKQWDLVPKSASDTADQVAWHNIRQADQRLDLHSFCASALGWLCANPHKSFLDLETELRQRNLNTHLIAANPAKGSKLRMINDYKADIKWECIFSCRPPPFAALEVLAHSRSVGENREKLAYAGSSWLTPEIILDNEQETVFYDDRDVKFFAAVMSNTKKLRPVSRSC